MGSVLARHQRCFGYKQDVFDPLHYLLLLERPPKGTGVRQTLTTMAAGLAGELPKERSKKPFLRQNYDISTLLTTERSPFCSSADDRLFREKSPESTKYRYEDQGKYEQAESLYQRALAIREQQSGPKHPDTANSLENLAELYQAQGRYGEAEPLLRRPAKLSLSYLGMEHSQT